MTNFLQETLQAVNGREVLWVGSDDTWMTWEDFFKLADFEYDDGFGREEINTRLIVVGRDWWLSRWEYDGSEGWTESSYPIQPYRYTSAMCMRSEAGHRPTQLSTEGRAPCICKELL